MLVFAFVVWAVIAVPSNGRTTNVHGILGQLHQHGWPWICVTRFVETEEVDPSVPNDQRVNPLSNRRDFRRARREINDQPHWSQISNWWPVGNAANFLGSATKIHWLSLCADFILMAVLLASIAAVLEVRMRRRSDFQFKLVEVGILLAFICFAIAWCKSISDETRRQELALAELRKSVLGFRAKCEDHSPIWVSRILNNNQFLRVKPLSSARHSVPIGSRATEIDFGSGQLFFAKENQMSPKMFGNELTKLAQVDTVRAWAPGKWGLEIQKYFPTERIRYIEFQPLGNRDFACLKGFQNLERLSIRLLRMDKTNFDYPVLPKLSTIELYTFNLDNPKVIQWLKQLPSLKKIQLRTNSIDEIRRRFEGEFPDVVFEAT